MQEFYEQFVTFEKKTGSQLYARCPMHSEKTASFTVNEETDEWFCHGCGKGGRYAEFIESYFDVGIDIAIKAAKNWEQKKKLPFPTEDYVDACVKKLWERPKEIEVLQSFGISEDFIRSMRIGWDDTRITFPIVSRTGFLVNVRKYLPPHRRLPGSNNAKCINIQNCGESRFYPYEAFDEEHETVWLVEGEKDMASARSQGLNAVTGTGGVNLPLQEINMFQDKIVYIMVDNDPAGSRITKQYLQLLKGVAKEVYRVLLPVKDFCEYWEAHHDANVVQYAQQIDLSASGQKENTDEATSLSRSEYVESLNSWIKLEEMCVVGADPKTYTIPDKLKVACGNQACQKPCQIASSKTSETIAVDPRQLLQFIDAPDEAQDRYLRKLFGCKYIIAEPATYVNIQKILFQETASFMSGLEEASFEPRYGIFLYEETRLIPTVKYDFEACRVTDPRSQQNYYVIRSAEKVQQYEGDCSEDSIRYFRSLADQFDKASDLINCHYDMWKASTGIEGRPDLFGAILLTYLSVTEIPWKGGTLKGWLDTMVIGDTRTGKSQMAQRMVKQIRTGSYINGENARRTGIIGGVQRFGDSWVITWGAIPMNDRGLLIIDEASGLSIEDIKELSATRSSGAVTINKIAKGEARARTRLLWFSNPRSGRNVEDFYWKGYGAFTEYIPVVEDQARYDLVITAARGDVEELHGIEKGDNPDVEKLRELITFAWSVPESHVLISADTERAVADLAKSLDADYGGGPLVVGVAVHEKIIRLSAAFAILCGCIQDGRVRIEAKHVAYAEEFLRESFDKPTLDYKGYINEHKKALKNRSENTQWVRTLVVQYPALKVLLSSNQFRGIQVQEILGIDKLEASKIISELLKRGLLRVTNSSAYAPDKLLIEMAKQMEVID